MAAAAGISSPNRLEAPHRSHAAFEMLMITFQPVVQVFRGSVLRLRKHSAPRGWIARGRIRGAAGRSHRARRDRRLEERVGRSPVTPVAEVHIDDLAVFINRSK